MKAVVVGVGTLGKAVQATLEAHGHDVIAVDRDRGERRADMTDLASLQRLFGELGSFDAVACAAGEVYPAPLDQATDEQWLQSIGSKGMGQVNVVRAALPHISDGGSFVLVSGVLGDEFTHAASIGTAVNGFVEGFVKAAATELPRGLRINCISPTVLVESPAYYDYFPGFTPVPASDVGLAYLRALSNPFTGHVIKLHKTNQ